MYLLFIEKVLHCNLILDNVAVVIFADSVCRDHYKVNRIAYLAFLPESCDFFLKFISVFGRNGVDAIPEFHFTDIYHMVGTADDQVYLASL